MNIAGVRQMTDSVTLGPHVAAAAETTVASPKHTKAETRWRAPEKQELVWERWDEQYAVYDARSGETHLLAEPTARLLQCLVACPGTVKEVTEVLCNDSGECCDEHSWERIAQLLRQLHDAGLVEKAGT